MMNHTHCPKCGSDSFDTPQWSSRSGVPPFEDYHVCCSCDHEWLDSDEPSSWDDSQALEIASLREKLNYERRVNGILADKLAAAEYDLNHYKSILKKALEK
jgi:hypothetical protein